MRFSTRLLLVAFLLVAFSSAPAAAQMNAPAAPSTEGFFISAQGIGNSLSSDDIENSFDINLNSGFGAGLEAGYGFTENFGAFVSFDFASLDVEDDGGNSVSTNFVSGYLDIGVEGNLSLEGNLIPFARLAYSGAALALEEDGSTLTFSGAGYSYGAGARYFFSPDFALHGMLLGTSGDYNQLTGSDGSNSNSSEIDDTDFDSWRLGVGLTYYF